jgi:hypothetical protein
MSISWVALGEPCAAAATPPIRIFDGAAQGFVDQRHVHVSFVEFDDFVDGVHWRA